MNDLDIRQMVLKIMNKAMEKTENTSSDIFIDFQGHVRSFSVRVYINGWKPIDERTDDDVLICKELSFKHDPKDSAIKKLQGIYDLLYSL